MANGQLRTAVRHLCRVVDAEVGGVSDADLLERFLSRRDEAAFELLVRRHERMVLGVCRRVLHHAQDAEDAFQATFLALVRKGGSISKREVLAGWLYRVAYRAALRAQARALRRAARERPVGQLPDTPAPAEPAAGENADLRPLLDQEVSRLPEKYRVPIVLCYLEGQTYEEAARHLGCSRGTVSTRLTRARELLRKRLTRRGLALSTGVLTTVLASASAPAALVTATVKTGLLLATGQSIVGLVSAQVAGLTEGVLRAMFLTKIKTVTAVLLAVAFLGAGLTGLTYRALADRPGTETKEEPKKGESGLDGTPAPETPKTDTAPAGTWQERSVLLGHEDNVLSVAFAPDGKTLASASRDGAVKLWDPATGKELAVVKAEPDGAVYSVVFSPDGKLVITGGGRRGHDGAVRLWDRGEMMTPLGPFGTLREVRRLTGADDVVTLVACSPDGKTLAAGSRDKSIRLWDLATGKELQRLDGHTAGVFGVAFSPDGKFLASVGGEEFIKDGNPPGEALFWDVATGKPVFRIVAPTGTVTSVAFSADGKTLATGSFDATVRLWDAAKTLATGSFDTTARRELKGHTRAVRCVAFSPDGKTLASGGFDNTVRLWDVATGKEVTVLKGQAPIMSVAFSPDGRLLATGSGGKQGKPTDSKPAVKLWELKRGRPAREPEKPEVIRTPQGLEDGRGRTIRTESGVTRLAFTPDGKRLLTAHRVGIVRTWDVASGKAVSELKADVPLTTLAVSPDGRAVAGGGGEPGPGELIEAWDMAVGKRLWQSHADKATVTSLAFSPDGKRLASGGDDGLVRQWDAVTGKEVRSFGGVNDTVLASVRAVAFSPDGKTLAAAGFGEVKIWDAETGKVVAELKEATRTVRAVAFSPDGKTLAAATDEPTLMLWDVRTGKLLFASKVKMRVTSVAFSPDGKTLATGSGDGTVRLWDVATGKERAALPAFQGEITSVAFSPEGRLLAAAGSTRTEEGKMGAGEIRLWDLQKSSGVLRGGGTTPLEMAPASPRLNKLLDELLQSKRSDEQVLEALFLAALGRLPTDTEKKFVLTEVSKQKDRREAFGDLLYALLCSLEFEAHAEELNRAVPRLPRP